MNWSSLWGPEDPFFSEIDTHFAGLMAKLAGVDSPEVLLAAALVSRAVQAGHVCLDLRAARGMKVPLGAGHITCPDPEQWAKRLRGCKVVGGPGDFCPLILDSRLRLYLYRYFEYETLLARRIVGLAEADRPVADPSSLRRSLSRLFPTGASEEADWQKLAAVTALTRRLCIISGGPGTGKTTLIAKILFLLLEQQGEDPFRVALCAPTGKAAARLQESVGKAEGALPFHDTLGTGFPAEATTLHRLLSPVQGTPYFRHNAKNPLQKDLVVVDEASMVDLALMSKLLQALHPQAGLILLGDGDQLSSVEAGAVLGDICDTGNRHGYSPDFCRIYEDLTGETAQRLPQETDGPAIRDCIVQLRKNYRFGGESGIGALSRAVNAGDGHLALRLLKSGEYRDIRWRDLPSERGLAQALRGVALEGFASFSRAGPEEFFSLAEKIRILCVLRRGPWGVETLNHLVERILGAEGVLDPTPRWYEGRPIMINRNDYGLGLFNGDTGVILPDEKSSRELRAFFLAPEGRLRKFQPFRLPDHETVYAMTVHKSQGSEFQKTILILPDRPTPVLTRELIYTAVTRARKEVEIWGAEDLFAEGVSRRIERASGLRDAIWDGPRE